jgi:hypothetical protein
MACHNNLPHCQIKTAARTNFTGKNGLPLSEKTKKSFGSQFMTNRTFGKECWQGPLFNLCYPSSKSGRFIWRSRNHYSTKHNNGQVEGHVTRVKLIKRMMYGKAGFALLRQRILHRI